MGHRGKFFYIPLLPHRLQAHTQHILKVYHNQGVCILCGTKCTWCQITPGDKAVFMFKHVKKIYTLGLLLSLRPCVPMLLKQLHECFDAFMLLITKTMSPNF